MTITGSDKGQGSAPTRGRNGKPTLKTIAELSGLAVPTVSRALSDAPDIGKETKKKVRKIAADIGYIPNRAGVRLRTGRTNVISLVMSTEHDLMSHTARLISSVAEALHDSPYHLIVTPFFPNQDLMAPVRYIVESGSADAIIMNQIRPQDPRVAYLMDRKFPFATHGRSDWARGHSYFDFDNTAFARVAVRQLADRGRKHVLAVTPPQHHAYAQHMIDGLMQACAERSLKFTFADGITSDAPNPMILDYIDNAIRQDRTIDAILTSSTSSAMAAVAAVERQNMHVGRQIDICAKEAVPFLKLFRSDILTTAEKVDHAGAFLAKAAIQAIDRPDLPPLQGLEVPE